MWCCLRSAVVIVLVFAITLPCMDCCCCCCRELLFVIVGVVLLLLNVVVVALRLRCTVLYVAVVRYVCCGAADVVVPIC